MFQPIVYTKSREENYEIVIRQLESLIDGEEDLVANMANASALLHHFLANINWVGFYIWKENELVLGPFQGLPACIRIPYGKGVCGTAVKKQETIVVPNVNEFPGHIVCDAQSKSEIVVPLIKDGEILGVLDIDSPIYNRFDETNRYYLEKFVQTLIKA